MDALGTQPLVQLRYTITEASSYSGSYVPHNILYDRPHDMRSRWTGAAVANMVTPAVGVSSTTATTAAAPPLAPEAAMTSRDGGYSLNQGRALASGSGTMNNAMPMVNVSNGMGSSGKSLVSPTATTQIGGGLTEKQYLVLKLERPAILRKIYFGKFHKAHPCNLKDFKVYGSATTHDPRSKAWVRLVRGVLKNDAVPESFETRWTTAEGVPFPVRYIKLVPLATHLPNYNFSIWYVALEGISNPTLVKQVATAFHEHRESVTLRLILKHLRSRAHHSAYRILLESSKLDGASLGSDAVLTGPRRPFERPIVTQLFHSLMQGTWDVAEACLDRAAYGEQARPTSALGTLGDSEAMDVRMAETSAPSPPAESLFSSYVERAVPKPVWHQVLATDQNGDTPCGRGGHQMELDVERNILWLFGGWDGTRDLSDLWAYHIQDNRWRCVSRDVRLQGGPSPRSCHKMVFDPRTGFLYVFGKYVDYEKPSRGASPSRQQTASPRADGGSPAVSSVARGLFLPRFPGSSTANDTASPGRTTGEDGQGELFASNRGGSMRLAPYTSRPGYSGDPTNVRFEGHQGLDTHTYIDERMQHAHIATGYEPDFYRFSTRSERWDRLSQNTFVEGGPKLLFDHEMLIDPEMQMLYIFGGRVAHPDVSRLDLSGLWQYDVIQRSWTFLFDDNNHPPQGRIPSRVGHTLLLDTPKTGSMAGKRLLWVLAGQRGTTYLADMWTYQINNGVVREISRDYSLAANGGGPEGGFTQRANIDIARREIFLFSGLVRRSKSKGERVKSAFWVYHIERNEWRLAYQHGGTGSVLRPLMTDEEEAINNGDVDGEDTNEVAEPGRGPTQAFPVLTTTPSMALDGGRANRATTSTDATLSTGDVTPIHAMGSPLSGPADGGFGAEPRPRFAAQMVYDTKRRLFYIFGGNPAENANPSVRLDDLWSLQLVRPTVEEILRQTKFKLRQQRFLEMAQDAAVGADGVGSLGGGVGAMQALIYLQTQVSSVVNHESAEESHAFRKLMAHLLHAGGADRAETPGMAAKRAVAQDLSSDPLFGEAGSSPWMSPMPNAAGSAADTGVFGTPRASEEPTSVDAAPALLTVPTNEMRTGVTEGQSDVESDSEMLSVSQVLPVGQGNSTDQQASSPTSSNHAKADQRGGSGSTGGAGGDGASQVSLSARQLATEGQPSVLYRQRNRLFRSLCQLFPPETVEPSIDLMDCVEMSKLTF